MSRSMTVRVPSGPRLLAGILAVLAIVVLTLVGLRLGASLLSPGAAAEFSTLTDLQQVQTPSATYLGRVVSDRDGYVRLTGPAIIRTQPAPSGSPDGEQQVVVQLLQSEPYGVAGDLLIPREQVLAIANVADDAGLRDAYAQASGTAP
jgi:hypothetical protein